MDKNEKCAAVGCTEDVWEKGRGTGPLCWTHYKRWRDVGVVLTREEVDRASRRNGIRERLKRLGFQVTEEE